MIDEATGMMMESPAMYDLTVKVKETGGKIKIQNIPPEEFLVNRRATSLEDAHFVAHRTTMTVSDLCLLYTSPSPRDGLLSRMPSSA